MNGDIEVTSTYNELSYFQKWNKEQITQYFEFNVIIYEQRTLPFLQNTSKGALYPLVIRHLR